MEREKLSKKYGQNMDPNSEIAVIQSETDGDGLDFYLQPEIEKMQPRFPKLDIQFQESYSILFKLGDDLRQDMLTCQALRVMDNLWQSRSIIEDKPALVL